MRVRPALREQGPCTQPRVRRPPRAPRPARPPELSWTCHTPCTQLRACGHTCGEWAPALTQAAFLRQGYRLCAMVALFPPPHRGMPAGQGDHLPFIPPPGSDRGTLRWHKRGQPTSTCPLPAFAFGCWTLHQLPPVATLVLGPGEYRGAQPTQTPRGLPLRQRVGCWDLAARGNNWDSKKK